VTVLQKGPKDIVSYSDSESQGNNDVEMTVEVDTQGGLKRCGGQGDILSGVTGTMLAWGMNYEQGAFKYVSLTEFFVILLKDGSAPKVKLNYRHALYLCLLP
jgi:NAD(P)H-hydrate repair Nnr-like enzyme with NAD(P)H-hydrate dehydratase domain